MINRIVTAFEIGTTLAADIVLKFAERDMSPEDREELVRYAADIANRLIDKIAAAPTSGKGNDPQMALPDPTT